MSGPGATAGEAPEPLFLRAARGEETAQAPVWFMRQAGRYLAEYRELRDLHGFWKMVTTPELAVEVTLQPVRRFGFDAAILFSDIMTPLPSMGIRVEFTPGPVIAEPVRTVEAARNLRVPDQEEIAPFVAETVRGVRAQSSTPLIGFGGAPLTLATYIVEGAGSKEYAGFRAFLRTSPDAAHELLDRLAETTIRYLRMQVAAGAQALQLFDSWAGLHDARTFSEFGVRYARRVVDALRGAGVPIIYFATNGWHLLRQIDEIGADVVGVDWREPLGVARSALPGRVLQGNLDPAALFLPASRLEAEVRRVLADGLGGPHIFNLGHGMWPEIRPEAVARAVETIRAFARPVTRPRGGSRQSPAPLPGA